MMERQYEQPNRAAKVDPSFQPAKPAKAEETKHQTKENHQPVPKTNEEDTPAASATEGFESPLTRGI